MTNVDTLPLTSDDAAPVNPFAAAMFAEHFEQRRLDFLGRPIDETAPKATIYNTGLDAATLAALENNDANTRAWLDARKDDKGEPGGIYVPPVVHDREATPEEQAWLDAHPQYAIKPGETENYTYVPFGTSAGQEPPKMMQTNDINTRGTVAADSQFHPSGAKRQDHDYDAVMRVRCSRIWLTQDWGHQYWEFSTPDGVVGLHAYDDKSVLSKASLVYPLLTMQPQQRDTVDLEISYRWQRGTATKAARRELVEIHPKEIDMPKADATITAPLANAAERKRAQDAAKAKDEQPKPTDWEDHNKAEDAKEQANKRPDNIAGAAPYVRNHVKKHYRVEGKELNDLLKVIFGATPETFMGEHSVKEAYAVMDAYDADHLDADGNLKEMSQKPPEGTPAAIPIQDTVSQPQEPPAKPLEPASVKPTEEAPKLLPAKVTEVEVVREVAFTGRALFPSQSELAVMEHISDTSYKSGLLPSIKNLNAAKFIVETGRELGIPPALALRKIHLINGQPSMAAELMWAMVLNSGKLEDFEITEGPDFCTVSVTRKGAKKPYVTTFNLDMARKMVTREDGKSIALADKYNWRQMPTVMCKWRAISNVCRTIFPDVTLGMYSREEMDDAIDFTADPDSVKQAANA